MKPKIDGVLAQMRAVGVQNVLARAESGEWQ